MARLPARDLVARGWLVPSPVVSLRADRVTLRGVGFHPGSLDGISTSPTGGQVEYRLARNAVVSEFKKGRLSRLDVCDAHPELLRAARHVGRQISEPCPICEEPALTEVTFVFGARLPSGGRCVSSKKELAQLERRKDPVACYVIEVCPLCSWNHLTRMYPAGAGTAPRRSAAGGRVRS